MRYLNNYIPAGTALLACLLSAFSSGAQNFDTISLHPVTITSTRMTTSDLQAPFGLTAISKAQMQDGQQQLSPAEYLGAAPGLYFMDANNFTQDLRVSIRGVGSRAAFGIRGIRMMVDDLPESTPDGQGQIDNLDMGIIDRLEVVRGPASALYGNASGGVISFYTEEAPERNTLEGKITVGSYGFQQYQLKAAGRRGKSQFVVHGAYVGITGYRANSGMRNALFNGKYRYLFSDKTTLMVLANYANSPQADDAGALLKAQADTLPRSARDVNLQYKAGETVQQGRIGAVLNHRFNAHSQFKARLFATVRDFANKLAFSDGGIVTLNRIFAGGGVDYYYDGTIKSRPYRLHAGIDLENQEDTRKRYANLNGVQGALGLDQLEQFRMAGLFLLNSVDLTDQLELTGNIRFDAVRLGLKDHFLSDGDNSDRIVSQNASPMLGLRYSLSQKLNVYGNIATSFEMPALSELSANPGGGGFNPELKPQRSVSYEAGAKGLIFKNLRYEFVVYHVDGKNEEVAYELPAYPGRSFYRNAGASKRKGFESDLTWSPFGGLTLQVNYTHNVFKYLQYSAGSAVYDGNKFPGLPKETAFVLGRYVHKSGIYGSLQARYSAKFYADDANKTTIPSFVVYQIRAGAPFRIGKVRMECFAGLNNATNVAYYDNIRINAAGKRYYEPAAGRNWYGGVAVRI